MTAVARVRSRGADRREPGAALPAEWAVIAGRAPVLADTAASICSRSRSSLRPASVTVADNTLRLFCRYLLSATKQPPTGFADVAGGHRGVQDLADYPSHRRRGAVVGEHHPPAARDPAHVL